MISSLLSRRCWTKVLGSRKCFGNIFAMLVGAPANGKSTAIDLARRMLTPFSRSVKMGPSELTHQQMVYALAKAFPGGQPEGAWSYVVMPDEITTFMSDPDIGIMQKLAKFWDCPQIYQKETVMGTNNDNNPTVYKPYMTFLAGAQPSWFHLLMNSHTIALGLPSRMIFVWAGPAAEPELFGEDDEDEKLDALALKLPELEKVQGFIPFTKEAKKVVKDWDAAGRPSADGLPMPGLDNLTDYDKRRREHVGKLALVYAAARHPDRLLIEPQDVQSALDALFEVEQHMGDVLAMAGGNEEQASEQALLNDIWSWIGRRKAKHEPTVLKESLIWEFARRRFPSRAARLVIEGLVNSGVLCPTKEAREQGLVSPKRMFVLKDPEV